MRRDGETEADYYRRITRGTGPEDDEDRRHVVAALAFIITGGALAPHQITEINGKPYTLEDQ